jgi:hypothetical protein
MSVELNETDLMRQACMTAHDYLLHGKSDIDERLGVGYAQVHPELLAAYMQTAALDYMAGFLAKEIGGALERIAEAMRAREPV